jgi:AcrR family transcriptional regulator
MTVAQQLTERTAARSLAKRRELYLGEIAALVEATYAVIERTGNVDATVRDILAEAGLSTQAFYRHFESKDELFLLIVEDGRRQLAEYLAHRMAKATTPEAKVRAWVRGVMAQAADVDAAARTRPFLVNGAALRDRFPQQYEASERLFLDQLESVLQTPDSRRDALAIYKLAFGVMEWHLSRGSDPTRADIGHLADFAVRQEKT